MMYKVNGLVVIAFFASIFLVAGCGDNSSFDENESEGQNVVQGTVSIIDSLFLVDQSVQSYEGSASASGLSGQAGLTVELFFINKFGIQSDSALAVTTTQAGGEFRIRLPESVSPGASLILVTSFGPETLRAVVTNYSVDVNPASEYVFRKILIDEKTFDDFPVSEIVTLQSQAESAMERLDFSNTDSIGEALWELHRQIEDTCSGLCSSPDNLNTLLQTDSCKNCDLSFAPLATLDLSNADLEGANLCGADLRYTNLSHANLNSAVLAAADLRYARLEEASIERAGLKGADMRFSSLQKVTLQQSILSGANLYGANLEGATVFGSHLDHVDLRYAYMKSAKLDDVILDGADMSAAYMQYADLVNAQLAETTATNTLLMWADLSGATAVNANWHGANLVSANCTGVDMSGSDLRYADIRNACLKDAKVENADLRYAALASGPIPDECEVLGVSLNLIRTLVCAVDLNLCILMQTLISTSVASCMIEKERFTYGDRYRTSTDLAGSSLEQSNLSFANLSNVDLSEVSLEGADFSGAVLTGVTY